MNRIGDYVAGVGLIFFGIILVKASWTDAQLKYLAALLGPGMIIVGTGSLFVDVKILQPMKERHDKGIFDDSKHPRYSWIVWSIWISGVLLGSLNLVLLFFEVVG